MRHACLFAALVAFLVPSTSLNAQAIIAQNSGLANPDHVITFGANLYPNFTNITNQFPGITVVHARYFTTGVSNNLVGGFLTNDFSGPPNTLSITFASPINDLTFVYHQISTAQPSVFRAVLAGVTVFSFSHLWNQTSPNNYFGFSNIMFDELQLDFVSDFNVDTLAYNDANAATCTMRNGTNVNPTDYLCLTLPIIGTNWDCSIATNANTIGTILAAGAPDPGVPFLNGELLLQLTPAPLLFTGLGIYSFPVPNDVSLVGFAVSTQGVRVDAVGPSQLIVLLNAIDLVVGL